MRKNIALLALVGVMCFNSVSYAAIDRRVDAFSEDIAWRSYNEINPIDSLMFYKTLSQKGMVHYKLLLSSETQAEEQMYSREDAQIKVDEDIFTAKVVKIEYSKFDYANDLAKVRIEISQEMVSKIAKAQKVSLRFYADKGYTNTINVPNFILSEWKQVINTEE